MYEGNNLESERRFQVLHDTRPLFVFYTCLFDRKINRLL